MLRDSDTARIFTADNIFDFFGKFHFDFTNDFFVFDDCD